MSRAAAIRWALVAVIAAAGLMAFVWLERPVVRALAGLPGSGETIAQLERSQAELKRLAVLDPANAEAYRARFDEAQTLANRLRILEHNRRTIASRVELALTSLVAATLLLVAVTVAVRQARDARRLHRLEGALDQLARGGSVAALADRRRDSIGTVAAMVERVSLAVGSERQRLETLKHLAVWQEAARRQAHELRAPLTTARLEVDRAAGQVAGGDGAAARASLADAVAELERLRVAIEHFAAFARLPAPRLHEDDLADVALDFAEVFATAWPGVRLTVETAGICPVRLDRPLLRQVLLNLCDNAARALGERGGTVVLRAQRLAGRWVSLDVVDDGPGVAAELRDRLFEPYATTAPLGQGSGLGLAISRKVMLDHGGDLELLDVAPGACFRMRLPAGEVT